MSRLTIDISENQHKALKAMAALEGKTIRQYALERLFPEPQQARAAQSDKTVKQPFPGAVPDGAQWGDEPWVDNRPLGEFALGRLEDMDPDDMSPEQRKQWDAFAAEMQRRAREALTGNAVTVDLEEVMERILDEDDPV
ncbi:hypothetical protein [Alterisphingorhabdus coralli]|uniref:hypothetical protein n=1 Tax=Alterisphingorhabdus coralli TaxID=3071408 RepID=UPI003873766E